MTESKIDPIMDCRGIPICVGDIVVYPGRKGSSMWLSSGEVLPSINGYSKALRLRRHGTGRTVEVFKTGRVAVVWKAST